MGSNGFVVKICDDGGGKDDAFIALVVETFLELLIF